MVAAMTIPYQLSTNFITMQQPLNLFEFRKGGVYKIICIQNNKIYFGQTSCFIRRGFQHLSLLQKSQHSCLELQKDVDLYGLNAFRFEIVQIETELNKRLKLENKWIENTPSNNLYNPKKTHNFKTKPRIAQQVKTLGYIYPSIAEASRTIGKSSRNIRMKLDDPLNCDYERIEYHRNKYFDEYEVIVDGQYFKSTSLVVSAGLAKTTRQVRDRCRSVKWQKWSLVEKRSNDYPNRE
uniref:Putative GIY-YIG homing endonuclease n=1 Tax=Hazenia capsulata TaxID=2202518 RepID=A0A1W6EHK6_9CHLO|nr:putative GIY-YIG homing endonuclease [Hazenia capsulata]ARK14897.1 putative GIY-YIG homing endonuclease [Hazenia capsulata]